MLSATPWQCIHFVHSNVFLLVIIAASFWLFVLPFCLQLLLLLLLELNCSCSNSWTSFFFMYTCFVAMCCTKCNTSATVAVIVGFFSLQLVEYVPGSDEVLMSLCTENPMLLFTITASCESFHYMHLQVPLYVVHFLLFFNEIWLKIGLTTNYHSCVIRSGLPWFKKQQFTWKCLYGHCL